MSARTSSAPVITYAGSGFVEVRHPTILASTKIPKGTLAMSVAGKARPFDPALLGPTASVLGVPHYQDYDNANATDLTFPGELGEAIPVYRRGIVWVCDNKTGPAAPGTGSPVTVANIGQMVGVIDNYTLRTPQTGDFLVTLLGFTETGQCICFIPATNQYQP